MMNRLTVKRLLRAAFLVIMGLPWCTACNALDGAKKKDDAAPVPAPAPTPTPAPNPSPAPSPSTGPSPADTSPNSGEGGWSVGPGISGCAQQGKVWLPIIEPTKAGGCGEAEANICCSEDEIMVKYGSNISNLESNMQALKAQGMKLYQCSTSGSKTTFHFVGAKSSSIAYQYIMIPRGTPTGSPPANCPRPTLAELGLEGLDTGGSGTDTGTGSKTGTGTSSRTGN